MVAHFVSARVSGTLEISELGLARRDKDTGPWAVSEQVHTEILLHSSGCSRSKIVHGLMGQNSAQSANAADGPLTTIQSDIAHLSKRPLTSFPRWPAQQTSEDHADHLICTTLDSTRTRSVRSFGNTEIPDQRQREAATMKNPVDCGSGGGRDDEHQEQQQQQEHVQEKKARVSSSCPDLELSRATRAAQTGQPAPSSSVRLESVAADHIAAPASQPPVPCKLPAAGSKERDEAAPPWFLKRPVKHPVLRLHEELLDFSGFMQPSACELCARKLWVRVIAASCHKLWPSCKVRVFGSFHTGLLLATGDVDVAVTSVPCTPDAAMNLLAEDLLYERHVEEVTFDGEGVRVQSRHCGLRAVVVFNETRRLESSRLVRKQLKKFPHMRPLILFLKHFFLQRALHKAPEGLSSHLLVVLVSLFLRTFPHEKNDDAACSLGMSLGQFLVELFRHYGKEFDYDIQCLSAGGCTVIDEMSGSMSQSSRLGDDAVADDAGSTLLFLSSTCTGKVCLNVSAVRDLFAHGFHCLSHLLQKSSPNASMLCPLLLDAQDPLVLFRDTVLQERPALPRDDRGKESCAVDAQHLRGGLLEGTCSAHDKNVASTRGTRSLPDGEDGETPETRRVSAKRKKMVIQAATKISVSASTSPVQMREETDVEPDCQRLKSKVAPSGRATDAGNACDGARKVRRLSHVLKNRGDLEISCEVKHDLQEKVQMKGDIVSLEMFKVKDVDHEMIQATKNEPSSMLDGAEVQVENSVRISIAQRLLLVEKLQVLKNRLAAPNCQKREEVRESIGAPC